MQDQSQNKGGGKAVWFPAKRYGWGWGPPVCWQGWAVLILYFILIALCALWTLPQDSAPLFLWCCSALTVLLILVCRIKGEKPRWRWNGR